MISPKAAKDRRKPAPVPPKPLPPPISSPAFRVKEPACYDLSGWEPGLDISKMLPRPVMVYCRATLDYWYVDPVMRGYEKQCEALNIPFMAYHFFHPGHIQAQVNNFLAATVGIKTAAILDVEYDPGPWPLGVRGRQLANDAKAWLDLVETETGKRPWIYTSQNYWNYLYYDPAGKRNMQPPPWSQFYPVIAAWYPSQPDMFDVIPSTVRPGGFTDYAYWQYSGTGRQNGCPANDLNVRL